MSVALVERAQAGDRYAYEELARGVARRLFVAADRIMRDADAAEDAATRGSNFERASPRLREAFRAADTTRS